MSCSTMVLTIQSLLTNSFIFVIRLWFIDLNALSMFASLTINQHYAYNKNKLNNNQNKHNQIKLIMAKWSWQKLNDKDKL